MEEKYFSQKNETLTQNIKTNIKERAYMHLPTGPQSGEQSKISTQKKKKDDVRHCKAQYLATRE